LNLQEDVDAYMNSAGFKKVMWQVHLANFLPAAAPSQHIFQCNGADQLTEPSFIASGYRGCEEANIEYVNTRYKRQLPACSSSEGLGKNYGCPNKYIV
jgi:hypothetical protein